MWAYRNIPITAFFVAVSFGVCAEDLLDKPLIVVGDTWTFLEQTKTVGVGDPARDEWKYQITERRGEQFVMQGSRKGAPDTSELLMTDGLNLLKNGTATYTPEMRRFDWPLSVGKKWPTKYTYPRSDGGEGTNDFVCTAVAWEDVQVPGGKFKSLRIDCGGLWSARGGKYTDDSTRERNFSGKSELTYWYAPDARYFVKMRNVSYLSNGRLNFDSVRELATYELQKP